MLPEIYTYFITFLVIISIFLSLRVLSNQYSEKGDSLHDDKIKKWSIFGVLFAILILLVGLFAPLIFSGNLYVGNFIENDANNASTFNCFVAVAAVITTGLTFFMQYQLDKFESQFYEMLSLHKENLLDEVFKIGDLNSRILIYIYI